MAHNSDRVLQLAAALDRDQRQTCQLSGRFLATVRWRVMKPTYAQQRAGEKTPTSGVCGSRRTSLPMTLSSGPQFARPSTGFALEETTECGWFGVSDPIRDDFHRQRRRFQQFNGALNAQTSDELYWREARRRCDAARKGAGAQPCRRGECLNRHTSLQLRSGPPFRPRDIRILTGQLPHCHIPRLTPPSIKYQKSCTARRHIGSTIAFNEREHEIEMCHGRSRCAETTI